MTFKAFTGDVSTRDQPNQQPSRRIVLVTSSRIFKLIWWSVVACHVVNGVYLGAVAALYWYMTTPVMGPFGPPLDLPPSYAMRAYGATFLFLSLGHAIAIGAVVLASIRAKRLRFVRPLDKTTHNDTSATVEAGDSTARRLNSMKASSQRIQYWWLNLCGVQGRHFEIMFELRETIEIGLQTYQAYFLSKSISSTWINTLAVAMIAINCFSTPILHHIQARGLFSVTACRLLCLAVDSFLDFCSSVIVPIAVFFPYWRDFDVAAHAFPRELAYDDVWYTNAVQENHQLFIMSTLDFISTVAPHVSLLLNLRTLKKWIVEQSPAVAPTTIGPTTQHTTCVASRSAETKRSLRYVHLAACCWGMGVVVAHLVARHHPRELTSCLLRNNAWFVSKQPCAVVELSCYRLNTTGSAQTLDEQLALVDETSLSAIVIAHCSHLHMPSRIPTFSSLYGLVIFNSTIATWDDPNALHRDALPRLNYLVFVHVNFSTTGQLPIALTQPTLPSTLQDIEFFDSNLNALPDDIHFVWPHVVSLYIEVTVLRVVPRQLFQISTLNDLSLVGNSIDALPDDALVQNAVLHYLTLSGNPLTQGLPLRVSDQTLVSLQALDVEYTGITDLPDWTWRWLAARHDAVHASAWGSPLCDAAPGGSNWSVTIATLCAEDAATCGGLVAADVVATEHHVG